MHISTALYCAYIQEQGYDFIMLHHASQLQSKNVQFTSAFSIACTHAYASYIPEKRKFSGILCFRQQRSRRRRRRRRRRVTISLSAR